MTGPAPSARSYAMRLEAGPGGVEVRIERRGPANPLAVARGRPLAEALVLPRLLFPVCPVAHTAAALRAAEAAAGLKLSPGQGAARELLVYAEAVAGCIWRSALTWPALIGASPRPEPVREARTASEGLAASLFSGAWAQPGGADMVISREGVDRALRSLADALASLENSDAQFLAAAQDQAITFDGLLCDPLDRRFHDPDVDPEAHTYEETPRSIPAEAGPIRLEDWFRAARDHGRRLLDEMTALVDQLSEDQPQHLPKDTTGTGLGQAITARGRLRHVMTLERGIVTSWQSAAPTDWNFAPKGAAARYAAALPNPAEHQSRATWLIAALDPCAPCELVPVREVAHA